MRESSAQRLSASSSGSHLTEPGRAVEGLICSTPLGVIVGFTMAAGWGAGMGVYCSTPLGVIVGFTLITRVTVAALCDCSTPLGVIVGFTVGAGDGLRVGLRLLNASRRHRRVHAVLIRRPVFA